MTKVNYATYQATPSKDSKGTFYFTDCGHTMYSIRGYSAYHKALCPGCFCSHKQTILYMRGTEEANRIMSIKLKEGKNND